MTGRIVDPYDIPVSSASVQFYSGSIKLLDSITRVDLGGQFSVVLHGANSSQVRVEIAAPGYLLETRNVLIERDTASLGLIHLKKSKELVLEPFTHSISADQRQLILEAFLVNESQVAMEVASLSISGTKLLRSDCLDLRPGLIYDIHDGAHGALSAVNIQDPSTKYDEDIAVDGTFERLPCKQQRVSIIVPYRFVLDSKERTKVQIRLPRHVKVGSSEEILDLQDWQAVRFTLKLTTGLEVYSEFLK